MANLETVLGGDDTIRRNFSKVEELYARLAALEAQVVILEETPLYAAVDTTETTATTTYTALATAGPSLTAPSSGTYIVEVGAYARNATAGTSAFMSYDINGSGANDSDASRVDSGVAANGSSSMIARQETLTAGAVVTAKYRASGGTALWAFRWIRLTRIS